MPKVREYGFESKYGLDKRFYTPEELSECIGISVSALNKLRMTGEGPKYIKVGFRSCRYPAIEVEKWLEGHTISSTSETPAYKLQRRESAYD